MAYEGGLSVPGAGGGRQLLSEACAPLRPSELSPQQLPSVPEPYRRPVELGFVPARTPMFGIWRLSRTLGRYTLFVAPRTANIQGLAEALDQAGISPVECNGDKVEIAGLSFAVNSLKAVRENDARLLAHQHEGEQGSGDDHRR